MVTGYGEVPEQQQPNQQQQQQGGQMQAQQQGYCMYPEDYQYYGDTFRGMQPNDQAAQIRKAIFDCPLPDEDSDFGQWIPMLTSAIDMVARIPGADKQMIRELNLRMEHIVDRAHSQGRKRQVAAKMQKLLFRLRSYVAIVEIPHVGMSGVGAMVTTNQNVKQDIRYPQQPQQQAGSSFWPWNRNRGQQ